MLFTWCAPILSVIFIIQLIVCAIKGTSLEMSSSTTSVYVIYLVFGTIYTFVWGRWADDADKVKKGNVSLDGFPRKLEWNQLCRYNADCKAYAEWEKKCGQQFWENLTGLQFEEEIARLYSNLGYNATKTRASNDGGVDVILTRGYEKIAVQCKAYNKKISPNVARELYGVICAEDYTSGIIATVNGASYETLEFCRKCKGKTLKVIDMNSLIQMQSQV